MKIIDLTAEIYDGMPVYPGDPEVAICETGTLEKDGYRVSKIQLNDHAGTHVETQYHLMDGRTLDEEPIGRFMGMAMVVDAHGGKVEREDIEQYKDLIAKYDIVIVRSGYSCRAELIGDDVGGSPSVSLEAIDWLIRKGIKMFCIDASDFDPSPCHEGHRLFFRNGVLIVEGLVNVDAIRSSVVRLLVMPLRIRGVGSSPCRVVAIE